MTSMNISLSSQMKEWVEGQIASGAYNNSSEYIRNLIRKDQEQTMRDAAFIAAIEAGRNSVNVPYDYNSIIQKARDRALKLAQK